MNYSVDECPHVAGAVDEREASGMKSLSPQPPSLRPHPLFGVRNDQWNWLREGEKTNPKHGRIRCAAATFSKRITNRCALDHTASCRCRSDN